MAGVGVAFTGSVRAQTPSFHLVGNAAGTEGSRCTGVSADGRVASGWSGLGLQTPGFTWTAAGGRNDFGLEPGLPSQTFVNGISGDSTTLVGTSQPIAGGLRTAYRYRGPGTFQTLGNLAGLPNSTANGVSGDGNVIVGVSDTSFGSVGEAFRWTPNGGIQGLGYTRPGSVASSANAVSRDGTTIVGKSINAGGYTDAFVWTATGGMRILPQISGTTDPLSSALGVNFDGSIVVGRSGIAAHAARWVNGQAMDLGTLPDAGPSLGLGVSDDGRIVVGNAQRIEDVVATIWTPDVGMEQLATYLARQGVLVPIGWRLVNAYGVSADGRTIVGVAEMPGNDRMSIGFVATIPNPSTVACMFLVAGGWLVQRRRRAHSQI